MKNIIKNFTIMLLLFTIIILTLLNITNTKTDILISINNYYNYLFPSLIIFLLLGELLTNYGFIELLNIIFFPLIKILKINSYQIYILFMSIISGCPSNAKYTVDLCKKNYISIDEANKILIYSYFSNFIYMITILYSLINNTKYIFYIIISHYISNIILLLIFNNKKYKTKNNLKHILNTKIDFTSSLLNSIINTIKICLNTLIIISFFSIIVSVIKYLFGNQIVLIGLIEITNGMYLLNTLNNEYLISILSLLFLSFGGLSIHLQIKSVLKDTNIKYKYFLFGRILQSIISILLFLIATRYL